MTIGPVDNNRFPDDARCYFEIDQDNSTQTVAIPSVIRDVGAVLLDTCGESKLGGIVEDLGENSMVITLQCGWLKGYVVKLIPPYGYRFRRPLELDLGFLQT